MIERKPYVGDVGTIILTDLCESLDAISTVSYEITKPDGEIVYWACNIEDLAESIIFYVVVSGDFNVHGEYKLQVVADYIGDPIFYGDTKFFTVYKRGT